MSSSRAVTSATTSNDISKVTSADTIIKKEKVTFPPPEMARLLKLAYTEDYKLPDTMVNFKGTIRDGKGSITFLHNFLGMCLWHNLSGKRWVKHRQLNPHANQWDCDRLIDSCAKFLEAEPKLGRKVLGSMAHVDTHKLTRFVQLPETNIKFLAPITMSLVQRRAFM